MLGMANVNGGVALCAMKWGGLRGLGPMGA